MAPGIDLLIQERWDAMWAWLCQANLTLADQTERLKSLAQLLRQKREIEAAQWDMPENLFQKIQDLREACTSPFLAHPLRSLYACTSGMGLIFIYANPRRFKQTLAVAHQGGTTTSLCPMDVSGGANPEDIHEVFVGGYAPFPREQIHPWAEAAATPGYLFELATPDSGALGMDPKVQAD